MAPDAADSEVLVVTAGVLFVAADGLGIAGTIALVAMDTGALEAGTMFVTAVFVAAIWVIAALVVTTFVDAILGTMTRAEGEASEPANSSDSTTRAIRRFLARPSAVALSAMG